jgi:hypothetical protein
MGHGMGQPMGRAGDAPRAEMWAAHPGPRARWRLQAGARTCSRPRAAAPAGREPRTLPPYSYTRRRENAEAGKKPDDVILCGRGRWCYHVSAMTLQLVSYCTALGMIPTLNLKLSSFVSTITIHMRPSCGAGRWRVGQNRKCQKMDLDEREQKEQLLVSLRALRAFCAEFIFIWQWPDCALGLVACAWACPPVACLWLGAAPWAT